MKKIIIFLLLVLSVCVFGKTEAQYKPYLNLKSEANRNPNVNSLVFSGQMEENGKVVSIYKKNGNLIYVYGIEGEKPEITIVGVAGKNLFSNYGKWAIGENYDKIKANFLVFKNSNYTYVLSFYDSKGKVANLYLLEVYKRGECCPVFSKNLDNFSIYDEIFTSTSNKDILNKIPEDSDESYVPQI